MSAHGFLCPPVPRYHSGALPPAAPLTTSKTAWTCLSRTKRADENVVVGGERNSQDLGVFQLPHARSRQKSQRASEFTQAERPPCFLLYTDADSEVLTSLKARKKGVKGPAHVSVPRTCPASARARTTSGWALATSALTKRFRGHSPLDLSTPGRSAGAACRRGKRHTGRVSPVYSLIV